MHLQFYMHTFYQVGLQTADQENSYENKITIS